jgi:hypothetical protein
MQYRRRHLTATVLPNRNVLVTGGVASGSATADGRTTTGLNNLSEPTRAAEIWDPATGQWRTLASAVVPRGYHAVSILMPSGLVLHGASGDANLPNPNNPDEPGPPYPRQMSHEMFSPPYLFRGNRPTITSAPSSVGYGEAFDVETPYAKQITLVTWIRLPSVTHAFDANQRLNTLGFTRTATGIRVTAPSSGNKAPPGHYMLFVMNRNGVPSVGKIIQINYAIALDESGGGRGRPPPDFMYRRRFLVVGMEGALLDFGMSTADQLESALHARFGLSEFRPGQREAAAAVLAGRDVVAVMPTGAGKSLCIQMPAQHLDGK